MSNWLVLGCVTRLLKGPTKCGLIRQVDITLSQVNCSENCTFGTLKGLSYRWSLNAGGLKERLDCIVKWLMCLVHLTLTVLCCIKGMYDPQMY